jgi:putative copper export protein
LLTGTLAAWMHLPSLGALITTSYGRTLMVKLGLVFIVLSIGLLNWRRITPRLLDVDGPRAMRKSAALELLFAHAVLLVTAVLTRTSPMDH